MSPSRWWLRRVAALLFVGALLVAPAAFADAAPSPAPRSDGFEPVDGNMVTAGESIPGNRLLGAAYGFILVALLAYVGSITVRTDRVESELRALRERLNKKASGG